MIQHPAATSVGAVGLATAVIGIEVDPTGLLSIAGLLASTFPVAQELFRSLGYADGEAEVGRDGGAGGVVVAARVAER